MPESHQIWAIFEPVGSVMFWNLTEIRMLSTSYIFLFIERGGWGGHPQGFCWLHYARWINTNTISFIFHHHIQSSQVSFNWILVQSPRHSSYKGIKKRGVIGIDIFETDKYWSTIEKIIATVIVWNQKSKYSFYRIWQFLFLTVYL